MISMDKSEKDYIRANRDTMHIVTDIKWAKQHNGFRPGKMHVFLGASHAGKSTYVRTIIKDYFQNNDTGFCGLWLSEESIQDFKEAVVDLNLPQRADICLELEAEIDLKSKKEIKEKLITFMDRHQPALFIIDNITTSACYEGADLNEAITILQDLKRAAHRNNTALIVVAHSRADIGEYNGRIIEPNDVRGTKSIVNLAQFYYVLQNFKINSHIYPTLRISKHRGYDRETIKNIFWTSDYNTKTKTFDQTWFINWAEFKEKYKASDKLTGK